MSVTRDAPANAAAAAAAAAAGGGGGTAAVAADAAAAAAAARSGGQASTSSSAAALAGITFRQYRDERDLPAVMELIDRDLSEPYSVFTYRYFLQQWPHLCFLAFDGDGDKAAGSSSDGKVAGSSEVAGSSSYGALPIGVVVCKAEDHRGKALRGYVAMLVVDKAQRGRGLGRALASMAIQAMADGGADEVALEAEATNHGALALYRSLGFVRDKHLHRYYLNNADAYRLKLLLPPRAGDGEEEGVPLDVLADAAAVATPGLIA